MSYDPNTPSQPSYPPPGENPQQGYGQPQQGHGQPQQAYGNGQGYGNAPAYGSGGGYPDPPVQQGNGIGLAGFIVSIVSIITLFFGIIGIIVSAVAIVLSAIGWSRGKKGAQYRTLSLAGLILGIVTLVLDIVLTALVYNALT